MRYIDFLVKIWGLGTIVMSVLAYMNWVPGYQVKLISKTSISPVVYQFPATTIQLEPDFMDRVESPEINSVRWEIKKAGEANYNILSEGKVATWTIPPDNHGTYSVRVEAKARGQLRSGESSIHVLPTKPVKELEMTEAIGVSSETIRRLDLSSFRFQTYRGDGKWAELENVQKEGPFLTLTGSKEDRVKTWDNKVFLRYFGKNSKPSEQIRYESLPLVDSGPVAEKMTNQKKEH